jgi:hypothetical protein
MCVDLRRMTAGETENLTWSANADKQFIRHRIHDGIGTAGGPTICSTARR